MDGQKGLTARALPRLVLVAMVLAVAVSGASAPGDEPLNLIDLIGLSDRILSGTVTQVTEGATSGGVPYTVITLRVAESILGLSSDEYTFRTSRGSAAWTTGESVVLFLERPAAATGLQTTVGRQQGKLRLFDGELSSPLGYEGLFADVEVDASGLSIDQVAMLEGGTDAVDAEAFLDLVRRAVREDWIARGVMRRDGEAPSTSQIERTFR